MKREGGGNSGIASRVLMLDLLDLKVNQRKKAGIGERRFENTIVRINSLITWK